MNRVSRCTLVIVGGLAVGATLFALSFVTLDFVWTHFVTTDPKKIGLGDGVMVVGGGFVIGCTLGLCGLIFVLYRFWPRRVPKQAVRVDSEKLAARS